VDPKRELRIGIREIAARIRQLAEQGHASSDELQQIYEDLDGLYWESFPFDPYRDIPPLWVADIVQSGEVPAQITDPKIREVLKLMIDNFGPGFYTHWYGLVHSIKERDEKAIEAFAEGDGFSADEMAEIKSVLRARGWIE